MRILLTSIYISHRISRDTRIFMAIRREVDKFDYTCCNSVPRTCGAALILSKHKRNRDFLLDELRSSEKGRKETDVPRNRREK